HRERNRRTPLTRSRAYLACAVLLAGAPQAQTPSSSDASGAPAESAPFVPVTDEMLRNPDPADWLMYSRTYDAQRFSPLDQIHRGNVARLEKAWSTPRPDGVIEIIPIVYRGVMYLTTPGGRDGASAVRALDAATGDLLWEYQPDGFLSSRIKT